MKAELIKFKIHSSKFKDSKWKNINITDDLKWLHEVVDINKLKFYWFTGYNDVTNNEMYEGHIVKYNINGIDTVGYIEYVRERNRNGFYIITKGSISHVSLNEYFLQGSKPLIIGNIIDHIHLIENH